MSSLIWSANSLVGAMTSDLIFLGDVDFTSSRAALIKCCKIGIANAAVFPVPVWASPSRSWPFNAIGMECSWIGVASTYPAESTPESKRGSISKSLNLSGALLTFWEVAT